MMKMKLVLLPNSRFCVELPDGTKTLAVSYDLPLWFKWMGAEFVATTEYWHDKPRIMKVVDSGWGCIVEDKSA